ncbi:acyl-CoA dehydrogenase [Mycolicibacterium chubuense NBB4]|uniref:Acyl-CoA dehydrogenase n=1 Tax=Mycolicibacterium chubuense (strain NBB4) TaxID=710421 RepID=I4BGG9_MYCCN|nr:acyl-CoA dehydrogenase family protein [Mycolicibacterium chubuense]AFM16376.1 acyl-CoA dehydrogenase [Mycolicibacterium chubuense NBB4]
MTSTDLSAGSAPRVDTDLVAMMQSVFADYDRTRETPPTNGRLGLDRALWQHLDALGLITLTTPERWGGSGAGWWESMELLTAAVVHGVRLPLAEHDLLACWALSATGHPVDDAIRTLHVVTRDGAAQLPTPWAGEVDRIVLVWFDGERYRLADLEAEGISMRPGHNLIGEPRDVLSVDTGALAGDAVSQELVDQLARKSAMVRAVQVCAAVDRAVEMSIDHVASRVQFGRPLARFQAIQNLVADAAAEAALARAATEAALTTAVESDWSAATLDFRIATARSCAGHAASVVTRNAHQVHGAIGTTREHRLHEVTRAALAWRSECGSVRSWDERVAALAVTAGARGLWPLIADNG